MFEKFLSIGLLVAIVWIVVSVIGVGAHKADTYITDKANSYVSQPILKKSSY